MGQIVVDASGQALWGALNLFITDCDRRTLAALRQPWDATPLTTEQEALLIQAAMLREREG
jgi:hypothetical protein